MNSETILIPLARGFCNYAPAFNCVLIPLSCATTKCKKVENTVKFRVFARKERHSKPVQMKSGTKSYTIVLLWLAKFGPDLSRGGDRAPEVQNVVKFAVFAQ